MATSTQNNKVYVSNNDGSIHSVSYKIEDDTYELSSEKLFTHSVAGLNKILLTPDHKSLALLSKGSNPAI